MEQGRATMVARGGAQAAGDVRELVEELRRGHMRLEEALRGLNDGWWDWDLQSGAVHYSATWKAMLGYAEEEMDNHLDTWKRLVADEDRERTLAIARAFAAGELPRYEVEFRMRHKDGRWLWILARAALVRDDHGRPVRMVGMHVDITARRHAEILLGIQRDLAVELSRAVDLRAAYGALLAAATSLPGFDCGGVYDRRDYGALELLAHRGLSEEFVRVASWHDAWTPQAEMVGRGDLVYMVRADLPAAIGARLEVEGLDALAMIPLCDGGQVIGALNVSSHRHRQIDAGSRVALEGLAAQAAGGIARIRAEERIRRLNETLEQRVRERTAELEAVNRALRESEAKLRRLHESMMEAFVSVDMTGRILESNGAYRQMLGYDEQELGGLTYRDVTPERWHAMEQRIVDEQIQRRGWSEVYEKEYRRRDGSVFPVELRTFLIRDDSGKPAGMWAMVRDITARKTAEERLRAREEQLRLAQEAARLGLYDVDLLAGTVDVDPRFRELWGIGPEEPFTLAAFHASLHPDDREPTRQAMARCLDPAGDGSYAADYRIVRQADGAVCWVAASGRVRFRDGAPVRVVGTVQDISRKKSAEAEIRQLNENLGERVRERTQELEAANAALRESETRFRTLGEAAFEGVVISEDGRIVDGNEQFAAMLGSRLAEMIGRPVLDYIAPQSRELVAQRLAGEIEGGAAYDCRRPDGSEFPCEARSRMVAWEGRRLRLTAVRDLTEMRAAQLALAVQRAQLLRFQRLAEVSEINMGVVHQLSQPLSAIINNMAFVRTMMERGGLADADLMEAMGAVQDDLKRARQTIVRLRALAHPERPQRSRVGINEIVADLVRLLSAEAQARGIRLRCECAPGLPSLWIDEVQIQQAVLNLVRNGLDAVAGLEAGRREVRITTCLAGEGGVEVAVHDRGMGIRPEDQGRLFEPFFTTKTGGMGVGLRLTRTILEAHGGSVEGFDHGGGATFRILLPVG